MHPREPIVLLHEKVPDNFFGHIMTGKKRIGSDFNSFEGFFISVEILKRDKQSLLGALFYIVL